MKKKMSTCGHGIYKFKVSSLARKSFGAVASLDPLAENIWTGLLATLWVLIFSELKAVTWRWGLTVWMVNLGQSEPATTNAAVGCSVHWMGCDFSFDVRWG
jgi:hypothetical protein